MICPRCGKRLSKDIHTCWDLKEGIGHLVDENGVRVVPTKRDMDYWKRTR